MDRWDAAAARDWCSFCQELEGSEFPLTENIAAFLREAAPKGRVLLDDGEIVVVPSLGPLVVGHVLIVPRRHYLSVGALTAQSMQRFVSLYARVWDFLHEKFGHCVAFEHGCADGGQRGGACIDHAHMHLLPVCVSLAEKLSVIGKSEIIKDLGELRRWHAGRKAYVFYESPDRVKRAWSVDIIPSQLLRMNIAAELGKSSEWDWRSDFGKEKFCLTIELFEALVPPARATYAPA